MLISHPPFYFLRVLHHNFFPIVDENMLTHLRELIEHNRALAPLQVCPFLQLSMQFHCWFSLRKCHWPIISSNKANESNKSKEHQANGARFFPYFPQPYLLFVFWILQASFLFFTLYILNWIEFVTTNSRTS